MFMTVYDDTLKTYIGGEALEKLMQADSSLGWKHWLTLIFRRRCSRCLPFISSSC